MDEILPWTFMSNTIVESVESGDAASVEELVQAGVDLQVTTSNGCSLLWDAYMNNNLENCVYIA